MKWISALAGLVAHAFLASCATSVTRDEAIETAYRYTQVVWMPEERHVRHGPDSEGIMVYTPDHSLGGHRDPRGWWKPGEAAKSMPYQWGGFDTPESFLESLARGEKAGDIATSEKRRMGDAGVSKESCGVDCSGFVSRCWNLQRPYSTKQLPEICDPLESWDELKPGDILLNQGHVVLFKEWADARRSHLIAYEAGPFPVWRVSASGLNVKRLRNHGYSPWRYRYIREVAGE